MSRKFFSRFALVITAMFFNSMLYADAVWIDVRSVIEHKIDHIEGDVRISNDEIVQQVNALYPDKGTEIHLYCRSGGRAGRAMIALEKAGYTNVANAGGIGSARKERGINE